MSRWTKGLDLELNFGTEIKQPIVFTKTAHIRGQVAIYSIRKYSSNIKFNQSEC